MSSEPLTQREFDSWCKLDGEFKEQVREHIEGQRVQSIQVEHRLTSLEAFGARTTARTGILSTLVSTAVSGLVSLFKH